MKKPPLRDGCGGFPFPAGEGAGEGGSDAFAGGFQDSASSRLRTPLVVPPRRL